MKRLILLFCIWMTGASLWGQEIVRAEYFMDEDPGNGNGTVIDVASASNVVMALTVPLGELDPGLHNLYSRVMSGDGAWSHTFRNAFLLCKLQQEALPPVSRMEYFFDADPGFGLATPVGFQGADEISVAVDLPLETLSSGIHTLCMRIVDDNGNWSLVTYRNFLVQKLPLNLRYQVKRIEYFFDEDPGFGHAIPVEFQGGAELSVAVDLPLETLSSGIHTLYMRIEDDNGNWSLATYRNFMVQKLPLNISYKVKRIEYFFDEDPGLGYAIPVEFQGGAEISVAADLPLDQLSNGLHTLYVRTRDDKGDWGMVFQRVFMKYTTLAGKAQVIRMEYFVNEDPGFGKGTQIELNTPRETVMKYFVVDPGKLQPGANTLYVRTLDSQGRWGMVYADTFDVLQSAPCPSPAALIAADVAETTANLGWNGEGQGSSWDLLWVPASLDYSEDGILDTGIVDNPLAVDGLMQSTLYGFYARTACTDGQVSEWAGPGLFHTLPLPVNLLTLQSDPPGGGILTGQGSYAYGETVTISTSPNAHYIFQYWSGDTAWLDDAVSATAKVTMPAQPVTLTAHFLDVTGMRVTPGLQLRVYPNPAHELLWVELDGLDGTGASLMLMNTLGRIIHQELVEGQGVSRTSLSLSGLDPGLYILIIQGERLNAERKVIVR